MRKAFTKKVKYFSGPSTLNLMDIMMGWREMFLKILDGRNDKNKDTDGRVLDRVRELHMAQSTGHSKFAQNEEG